MIRKQLAHVRRELDHVRHELDSEAGAGDPEEAYLRGRRRLTKELERCVGDDNTVAEGHELTWEEEMAAWRATFSVPVKAFEVMSGSQGSQATVGTLKAIVDVVRSGPEQTAEESEQLKMIQERP